MKTLKITIRPIRALYLLWVALFAYGATGWIGVWIVFLASLDMLVDVKDRDLASFRLPEARGITLDAKTWNS